ncbi:aliphatic sulfonate ABC transporter substrate-binding protein [Leptolyngbya ohadii]|uniref:aliphatic sulfonate ABC transporter substrate-binding protein n=1 Tax=Leptolyngbya ohadii TaxID=1962290 RepID=UPI000B59B616|nr:aliphatic sulfonate ABC transporter substrate-binding protein [Leptolyngbya ohadii]
MSIAFPKLSCDRFTGLFAGLVLTIPILTSCTAQPTSTNANQTPATQTASANSTDNNQAEKVVRIGYVRWGLLPIVRQRGELEKKLAAQNIKVEWVGPFPAFAPVLEAVNAGEVDFTSGGDIPGISGLVGGTPVCVIAYQPPIPEAEAILVKSDSSIRSPQDLIGKKVAVNRGGWGEHLLLKVLAQANIPKEQVERVYLSPTDALPAVTQGHVDAWSVWEPNVSIAEVEHSLRPIASGEAASHYGVYMVQKDFLAKDAAVVKATLEAIQQEADWAVQNKASAAELFGKSTDLKPDTVKQLGQEQIVEQVKPLTAQVISGIQERADWMYSQKAVPKQIDIRQSVCPATPGLETYTSIQQ